MATCKTLSVLAAAVFALAAIPSAEAQNFSAGKADAYAAKQSQAGVTLAIKPYHTQERNKEIFDKAEPYKYGILPVLVVITNEGDAPLKLDQIHARYVSTRSREDVESISGQDLFYINPRGHAPKAKRLPGLGNVVKKVKKGPMAHQEVIEREFAAPILPPGETASGFFYFDVGTERDPLAGASIYVAGLTNMSTGQPLFYFEIPLSAD